MPLLMLAGSGEQHVLSEKRNAEYSIGVVAQQLNTAKKEIRSRFNELCLFEDRSDTFLLFAPDNAPIYPGRLKGQPPYTTTEWLLMARNGEFMSADDIWDASTLERDATNPEGRSVDETIDALLRAGWGDA